MYVSIYLSTRFPFVFLTGHFAYIKIFNSSTSLNVTLGTLKNVFACSTCPVMIKKCSTVSQLFASTDVCWRHAILQQSATRDVLLRLKNHENRVRPGSAPDSAGKAYDAPQTIVGWGSLLPIPVSLDAYWVSARKLRRIGPRHFSRQSSVPLQWSRGWIKH